MSFPVAMRTFDFDWFDNFFRELVVCSPKNCKISRDLARFGTDRLYDPGPLELREPRGYCVPGHFFKILRVDLSSGRRPGHIKGGVNLKPKRGEQTLRINPPISINRGRACHKLATNNQADNEPDYSEDDPSDCIPNNPKNQGRKYTASGRPDNKS
jgi:hypothetical protein